MSGALDMVTAELPSLAPADDQGRFLVWDRTYQQLSAAHGGTAGTISKRLTKLRALGVLGYAWDGRWLIDTDRHAALVGGANRAGGGRESRGKGARIAPAGGANRAGEGRESRPPLVVASGPDTPADQGQPPDRRESRQGGANRAPGQLASYSYATPLFDTTPYAENQELASSENETRARGAGDRTEDQLRHLLAPLLELPGAKLTSPARASAALAGLADAQVSHGAREEAHRIVAKRQAGQKVTNPIGWFLGLARKPDTAARLFPTVEALTAAAAMAGPWTPTGGGTPDQEDPDAADRWRQRDLESAVAQARVMASDPDTSARAALDTLAHTHQADPDISAAAAEAYRLVRGALVAAGTVPADPAPQAVAS